MKHRLVCLLVTLSATTGCFTSRTTERAARLDPLPEDCEITWEHGGLDRLIALQQQGYVQVAFISATPAVREFTPKLKKYLRPRVCKRGGNYVLMTATSGQGANGTSSFEVLSNQKPSHQGPVTD